MAVKPCYWCGDATEYYLMGDKHINLIHVEAFVSSTVEFRECLVELVSYRLFLSFIYICGKTNTEYCNDS